MPSNRIVDASPLILLAKTGQLELLRLGVASVVVPEVVMDEVRAKGPNDPATRAVTQARWLTLVSKSALVPAVEMEELDPGETAALSLAVGDPEAEVVIDDRAGRECAQRLGISCQGTLGVILLAKRLGVIPAAGPLVAQVRQAGLYLDDELAAKVLRLAGE